MRWTSAGKEALHRFDQTIAEGKSLSLETTLTGGTVLGRMQAAKDAGYDVTLRYVAVDDPETNIRRVQARATKGGHRIEPETVRRRVAGIWRTCPRHRHGEPRRAARQHRRGAPSRA